LLLLKTFAAVIVLAGTAATRPALDPARSAAVLEGTVVGPDGKPVAGGWVAARGVGESLAPAVTGQTDGGGRFRLALPAHSPQIVRVEAPGLAPRVLDRVTPGSPLRVSLAPGGVVEGIVRDARSGSPVAGALIEARDGRARDLGLLWEARMGVSRATSDAQGRFKLAGLGPGGGTVTATARGIGRAQRRSVAAGSRLELVLVPSGVLTGVIQGPEAGSAAGALVLLESTTVAADRLTVADRAGRFEFLGVEPGRYRITVRRESLAPGWQTVVVGRRAEVDVPFRLGPALALTGRLVDAEGRAVRGRVAVSEVEGSPPAPSVLEGLSTETAADGRFRLAPLPAGSLTLTATADGLGRRRLPIELTEASREVDLGALTLEDGLALHGFVRDRRGRPVADAHVTTTGADAEDTSAADGSFLLAGLEPGRYRLVAQAPGVGTAEHEAEPGDEAVVLVLQETGRITGVVVDGSGAPVSGYQVIVRPPPSPASPIGPRRVKDVDRPDGRFSLGDLAAGTYVVQIVAPDREPGSLPNVIVGPGSAVDVGTVRLGAGAIVRGTVVDAAGAGIAGAMVTAAPPRHMVPGATAEAGSGAGGAFELRGVPAGSVRVVARHPDYAEGEARIEVEPARGPLEARVVLRRGARVTGHARHRDGSPVAGSVAILVVGTGPLPFTSSGAAPIAADGSFLLEHVPAGHARLTLVIGPGASNGPEREVDLRESETATVAFELREVLVTGRVSRAGTPAPGLRIHVSDDGPPDRAPFSPAPPLGRSSSPERRLAVTREDGSYELIVDQPGKVRLALQSADGSLRLPARVVEIPDVEQHVVDLDLPGVVVAGRVVDSQTDRPLDHATLLAEPRRQGSDAQPLTTATSADGRFQLEVDPGQYRLSAQAAGYSAATTEVDVKEPGVADLQLPLIRGGTLRGRVLDARCRPALDGIVRALSKTPGAAVATAQVLPDGRFELSGLTDTDLTLVARSDSGGFALRSGVPSGPEEVTLVLRRGGRVQLRLLGPEGAPVAGAYVSVSRIGGVASPGITPSSTSDGSGLAEVLSPAGEVEVRASKLDGATLVAGGAATVLVPEGGTTTVEVRLARPDTTRSVLTQP
jgi:carboxypeptidase family protein